MRIGIRAQSAAVCGNFCACLVLLAPFAGLAALPAGIPGGSFMSDSGPAPLVVVAKILMLLEAAAAFGWNAAIAQLHQRKKRGGRSRPSFPSGTIIFASSNPVPPSIRAR